MGGNNEDELHNFWQCIYRVVFFGVCLHDPIEIACVTTLCSVPDAGLNAM